jgi:4'-phosphopantetheinyl transferase
VNHNVKIFYTRIEELAPADFQQTLKRFGVHFSEKTLAYKFKKDRYLALGGRLLLMQSLHELYGTILDVGRNITYNKYGKPLLEGVSFNISHSGEYVMCAISKDSQIGIDIEIVCENIAHDLIDLVFSKSESKEIMAEPKKIVDRFFKFWTRKEAVLKAEGSGLIDHLPDLNTTHKVSCFNGVDWYINSFRFPAGYWCTIASDEKFGQFEFCFRDFKKLIEQVKMSS